MGEISDALRRAAQSSKRPTEPERAIAPSEGQHERRSARPKYAKTLDVDPQISPDAGLGESPHDERPRAVLPRDRGDAWISRVVLVAPNTPAAECYRHFAIRVARDMGNRKARSVLVVGGLRMEGKTTTACNLALALAAMGGGRRIALVDFDLRAPCVSRVFGLTPEAGVEEVLSGHVPVADVRVATDLEGFDIYPVARSAAQPHELLAGEQLPFLMRELEAVYDTVVVDSAPLLLVPDTELIYPHVDCIAAIMRSGVTKRSDFERLIETIPESKLLGTFMNDVRTQRHIKRYGYYGGHSLSMVDDEYQDDDAASLPDFLQDPAGIPRRQWRWMLLGLILGLAGTTVAVSMHVLTYTARSSVLVTSQQIPEGLIPSVISEDPFSRLNAVVGQVRSRQKLTGLVEELDLYPEHREKMLMEDVVGMMRGAIHVSAHDEMDDRRSRGQTARVFYLSFTYSEPEKAAQVANRLAGMFLEAGIQSRIERSQEITHFLRQELTRAEEALREQNRLISEFNEQYRGELPGELNSNLSKLDRLTQQRQSLRTSLSELEARRSGPVLMGIDPNSPESRLADLQTRYQQAMSVYTSEHPTVRALARQIRALEKEVASGGYDAAPSPGSGIERAQLAASARRVRGQIAEVERQIEDLEGRVARTPKHQEELSALSERAMVAREKYLEFLRKVAAAELAQTVETAQQGAQVTIMDRAYTPAGPDSSREVVGLIGLGVSLGLALGLGVLRELIDPVMVAESQVQRITGLPSLGSVARIA